MTIFEPYAHQVAGHCSIFKLDGMVCKPLIPRECEFYQTIYREFPPLVPLTPEFHGSITIHNQKPTQDTHPNSPSNNLTIYRNPSLVNNYLKISNTDSTLTIPSSPPNSPTLSSAYIVLEDLTAGMSKPCAMDMKVGTRQRFTTSTLLGFRLCGMRVHRWSGLYTVDRLFGRGLTPETVEDAVAAFLFDGKTVRTELIPSILVGLRRMISVLEDPTFPFRFYTSSLLFIYEGDTQTTKGRTPRVDIKIIDFAHAIPKTDKEGEGDDGFLFGLRNLAILFQNIAARHGVLTVSVADEDDSQWELARARERDLIANRCTPIAPLLITHPMKGDNY
eukprot:Phypoly_transcript_10764.p1 GENE.Phypoly_transcript_10764~~Phypoly_transcript_10764.p1  ORF type:complete len:377 (+),score=36.52 Phypoly_transcript_10764:133-1131(+)